MRGFEYTCPTLKVTTELQELITCVSYLIYDGNSKGSIVHATEIALSRDCAPVPRDLEIAHWCARDYVIRVHNLEIGTQFRDSKNAQRNLEIAQIPKLRGTHTSILTVT